MIDAASIREIIEVYTKHGWSLRRVLLSAAVRRAIDAEFDVLFDNAAVRESDIDALWFSRATMKDGTTWEIRHLSASPFALLVVTGEGHAELEAALSKTEDRLRHIVCKRITGH